MCCVQDMHCSGELTTGLTQIVVFHGDLNTLACLCDMANLLEEITIDS